MTVLEIVKLKLNNDTIDESLLLLAIDEVEQAILNYCNIDVMPKELIITWANLAVDLINYTFVTAYDTGGTGGANDIDVGSIASLKIGDTQINVGGGEKEKIKGGHKINLDSLIMNYKEQLNKFRRLVW